MARPRCPTRPTFASIAFALSLNFRALLALPLRNPLKLRDLVALWHAAAQRSTCGERHGSRGGRPEDLAFLRSDGFWCELCVRAKRVV